MTEDNAKRRESIINKVRALLSKTVENSCTEEEALSAAEAASRLMEEYEIAREDIQSVRDDTYGVRTAEGMSTGSRVHPAWECACAVERFCGVKVWRHGSIVKIFGAQADTEFAKYLFTIFQIAIEREVASYLKGPRPEGFHGRTLRASFIAGMTSRISQRLHLLANERKTRLNETVTGNALVVVKDQELSRRFDTLGLKLRSVSSSRSVRSSSAYGAGRDAGDRVAFGRPVGGKSTRLLT